MQAYSEVDPADSRHERRTRLSLAHFLRARMMYSTWGFPEFRSKGKTSLSVSLERKQDTWINKIRSRMHQLLCVYSTPTQDRPQMFDLWVQMLHGNDRDYEENVFKCVIKT